MRNILRTTYLKAGKKYGEEMAEINLPVKHKEGMIKKLLNSLKAYLKGVINLKFEIGDVIELDFGKEYIIVNECIIETKSIIWYWTRMIQKIQL